MKNKLLRIPVSGLRLAIISFVFVVGVTIGVITLGDANANQSSNALNGMPNYPVNANGQTYGSAADAPSRDAEPDLIGAYGVDGTLGYVKKEDLNEELPKTPEEALAIQESKALAGEQSIPLYDVDGETVIGEFIIHQGQGQVIEKE
ncbi:peptidase M56 BlaR1 [Paenibacillus sp. 1P07SE]|uniref:peptidase M56 BlaR1 n=1 Tax=Paenibacillus sp. 1P07SE TaxID=3132209 RepID=UPI0039A433A8